MYIHANTGIDMYIHGGSGGGERKTCKNKEKIKENQKIQEMMEISKVRALGGKGQSTRCKCLNQYLKSANQLYWEGGEPLFHSVKRSN